MRRILLVVLFLLLLCSMNLPAENVKALFLLANNYGANYNLIRDKIEQYGWEITLTAVTDSVFPCQAFASAFGAPVIEVDTLLYEITNIDNFDCLLIISSYAGANPYNEILNDSTALSIISEAVQESLAVAAWCSGVRVLAAADVLNGKNITGHPNFISEYTAAGAIYLGPNLYPVIDGNIVTCTRGQYFVIQSCESIAELIEEFRMN